MPGAFLHIYTIRWVYLTSYTTTGLCSRIVRVCGKSPVDSQKDARAPSTAAHGGCRGSTPVLVASLGVGSQTLHPKTETNGKHSSVKENSHITIRAMRQAHLSCTTYSSVSPSDER